MKKRILSAVLALLMLVTAVPMTALVSFAETTETTESSTEAFDYNSLYAKKEYMDTHVDFFAAEASESGEIRITESADFGDKGGLYIHEESYKNTSNRPIGISKGYKDSTGATETTDTTIGIPAYFGDGYLKISSESGSFTGTDGSTVTYTTGATLSINATHGSYFEKDANTEYTYEYVIKVTKINNETKTPEDYKNIGQALCTSFGRIALYYNASKGTIYPNMNTYIYTNASGASAGSSFTGYEVSSVHRSNTRDNSPAMFGKSITVALTASVVTENEKYITAAAENGSFSGNLYMNGYAYPYSRLLYNESTGENYKLRAYGNGGTNIDKDDEFLIYALRRYTTTLTADELAHNRFVDVAKFYDLGAEFTNKMLALSDEVKAVVFAKTYEIDLDRTISKETVKETINTWVANAEYDLAINRFKEIVEYYSLGADYEAEILALDEDILSVVLEKIYEIELNESTSADSVKAKINGWIEDAEYKRALNRFSEIVEFYSLGEDYEKEILALDEDILPSVLENIYEIELDESASADAVKTKINGWITDAELAWYDAQYAQLDKMDTQIDFFTASPYTDTDGNDIKVVTADLGEVGGRYIKKGYMIISDSSTETAVYFRDGYLELGFVKDSTTGTYTTAGVMYINNTTATYEKDANTKYTYEYVIGAGRINDLDTPYSTSTIAQAICLSFGRIQLNYNSTAKKVYPSMTMYLYDSNGTGMSTQPVIFPKATFQEESRASGLGESMNLVFTADVTTANGAYVTAVAENGSISGAMYLNGAKNTYTQPLYVTTTAEDGSVTTTNYRINKYAKSGTGMDKKDRINVYAMRRYTTVLTADELALNHFIDIAKFYNIGVKKTKEVLALDKETLPIVLDELYSITLNSTNTTADVVTEIDAILSEATEAVAAAKREAYNALYVKQDNLILHADFFHAKASSTAVTSADIADYVLRGSITVSTSATEVYLGDSCLKLTHNSAYNLGGSVSFPTTNDENYTKFTYEYISAVTKIDSSTNTTPDNKDSIGQAHRHTHANISLAYRASDGKIYPTADVLMYPNTANTTGYKQTTFISHAMSTEFTNLSSLGETAKLVHTVDITMDNESGKYITELPKNGVMNGHMYVNGQGVAYTFNLFTSTETDGVTTVTPYRLTKYFTSTTNYDANQVKDNEIEFYAIREYNVVLTEAELAQNNLVDIAKFYLIDIDRVNYILSLEETAKNSIMQEAYSIKLTRDKSNATAAQELEAIISKYAPETFESLEDAESVVSFLGYEARLNSFPGIRATFEYNETALKALEEQGYSLEMGVIMAIAIDGRTASDLALRSDGDGYATTGMQMINRSVYKDGAAVGSIITEEGKNPRFIYTITYQQQSSQTAEMYSYDCIYRGYLIAEKDGEVYINYYDCNSEKFDYSISVYELSAYWMYEAEEKLDNDILKSVISAAGYTDEINTYYETYKASADKAASEGFSAITTDELNILYNINLKADKDPALKLRLKYYEDGGKASSTTGNIDIYTKINDLIDAYGASLGVDVRDELYEITTDGVTVIFDVTTDKDPYSYTLDEDVTFTMSLKNKDTGALIPCDTVSYNYKIDGVSKTVMGTLSAPTGVCSFTVPAEEIKASTLADKGVVIRAQASVIGNVTQEVFNGGAIVDMDKIVSNIAEPTDFEDYWAGQIESLEAVSPTDTNVTEYTGDGVVISDKKRVEAADGTSTYVDTNPSGSNYDSTVDTTTEGKTISEDNYFHIIPVDADRLAYLKEKGYCSSIEDTTINSYNVYEVYLKSPGPAPSVGMLVIPHNLTATTGIRLTFFGYGASSPASSAAANSKNIMFFVSHNGYWTDASKAELYNDLQSTILSAYGRGSGTWANSHYDDLNDNYILYMYLRILQAMRFVTDVPVDTSAITDETLKSVYDQLNTLITLKEEANDELKLTLVGTSMGGYQVIGAAALAELYSKHNSEGATDIIIESSSSTAPSFCNFGGPDEGRMNRDGVVIDYTNENMRYYDGVFFAKYITTDMNIARIGLGDYTCTPSSILAAYNAMNCNKQATFYQNATHMSVPTYARTYTITNASETGAE